MDQSPFDICNIEFLPFNDFFFHTRMKYLAVSQIVYMLSSLPPHLKIV